MRLDRRLLERRPTIRSTRRRDNIANTSHAHSKACCVILPRLTFISQPARPATSLWRGRRRVACARAGRRGRARCLHASGARHLPSSFLQASRRAPSRRPASARSRRLESARPLSVHRTRASSDAGGLHRPGWFFPRPRGRPSTRLPDAGAQCGL
jgi:hypothetical protein